MFHSHKINLIILILISIVFGWQLFKPGFFSMHDDLQVMRLYEMDRCYQNGQIPCRWSPDMGAGYGQPMFNFYSVLPYNLGELFHLLGFSFIDTVKVLFFLALLGSGVFSYLFLSEMVIAPAALVGSLVYLITPYRAVDIFVRGAMSETWALTLMPLVLWAVIGVVKRPSVRTGTMLAITLGGFLTTHNISSMISPLIFIPFTLLAIYLYRPSLLKLKYLLIGGLIGVGLSAFFTLPVALERNLVQTKFLTSDYFDFHIHYATLKQLLVSQRWGYGPSQPGSDDNLSFAVGIIQTLGLIILPFLLLRKYKDDKKTFALGSLFWLLATVNIFLTHSKSVYVWDRLPFLAFVQFPWRFLGMAAVGTSAVAAIVVGLLPRKWMNFLVVVTSIVLISINFRFFSFDKYFPAMTDAQKLSGQEFINQQKSALVDYLPVSSKEIPSKIAPDFPIVSSSRVNIHYYDKRSGYFASEFDVYDDSVTVTFPVVYFPGWTVYHNRLGDPYPITYDNDLGLITVKLTKGYHIIQGFFENTPSRMIGNVITFISAGGLLLWLVLDKHES